MSGVGVSPDPPQLPAASPKGCAGIKVRWGKSDGKGFPVHKYRLYRHTDAPTAKHVVSTAKSSTDSTALSSSSTHHHPAAAAAASAAALATASPLVPLEEALSSPSTSTSSSDGGSHHGGSGGSDSSDEHTVVGEQWKLVYDGAEVEFLDGGELLSGEQYEYKVKCCVELMATCYMSRCC